MRICAITMVCRDYWALSQWYAHYGRHCGEANLFIVAHGDDPLVQSLCPKASVITIPRDDLKDFDRIRSNMLNSLQSALGQVYDWVIRTDTDELVCIDPSMYSSLHDMVSGQTAPALFALGLNVVEMDNESALNDRVPVLIERSNAVFSGHYSKAWAVRGAVVMERHGIRVRPGRVVDFDYALVAGVYLLHLKYANRAVMQSADASRMSIALSGESGVPGKAWKYADEQTGSYFREVEEMPLLGWEKGRTKALRRLRSPVRNLKSGFLRSRSPKFDFRTILPDWFKKC